MGDEIADLVSPTDADAVVFVRASATHKTLGARFAIALANPYADSSGRKTIVRMTLVHPETGNVLALFETTAGTKLDKPLAKAVSKLPNKRPADDEPGQPVAFPPSAAGFRTAAGRRRSFGRFLVRRVGAGVSNRAASCLRQVRSVL